MAKANIWTVTEARKRFADVVHDALAGAPQSITRYGKQVLVVVDEMRFDIRPKPKSKRSVAKRRVKKASRKHAR